MSREFHKVLKRHLDKYWKDEPISAELQNLLQAINESFFYYERDRELMERAMEVSSLELTDSIRRIRKELEQNQDTHQRIRQSEHVLHSITTNLQEAVFRRTLDGKLVFANQAFIQLFRFESLSEALSIPRISLYVNPEDSHKLFALDSNNNSNRGVEILFKRKDGSRFWGLASSTRSIDVHGVIHIDGAIVDITEQKHNEDELRKINEDLQKTNAELDRFVYSASHDLRAPLMSLLGLINLIELEKKQDNRISLELMRRSINKLDLFIKDIIDYSYNARTNMNVVSVDFNELINAAFEQFEYISNAYDVKRIVELEGEVPFYSDLPRLRVIFNNLISNALRYQNRCITNQFIKIKVVVTNKYSVIEVSDNGVGIAEEHQQHVFQMFYRATTENTGSGLGLYIVKEAIDKLEGTVQLSSVMGKGTSFVITLPNRVGTLAEYV